MTVPELADRLGVDQSTAWRYLRHGKLPGVQVGSRWLIDRQRVERFLAGKEDAVGNLLVTGEPSAAEPMLELAPHLEQTAQALDWLRGLAATLELLMVSIEKTATRLDDGQAKT